MDHPSVAEIIAAIGVSNVAREFGHENVSTVSSWKLRGAIPVAYWPRLVEIAAASGVPDVSYETLVNAHAKPSSKPDDAA